MQLLSSARLNPLRRRTTALVSGTPVAGIIGRRRSLLQWLYLLIVVLPSLGAGLFYGLIASDRYVSETSFIVRGNNNQQGGGLASLFRSFGLSRTDDDTFAVQEYLGSREAVRELDNRMPLREIFSRPGTDWITRFPTFWRRNTFEGLYRYFQNRVTVTNSSTTGITKMEVATFRPEDSYEVSRQLLKLAEELVNRLNERANRDTLQQAQQELDRAEQKVIATQGEITAFRNREMMIDPNSNSAKTLEIVGKLFAELAQTRVTLQELVTSAPSNPSIPNLRVRATALQEQINSEQMKMAGKDTALASKMSAYERLVLTREFADRELTLSSSAFEVARQQARRQQIYIETIAGPNLPDQYTEPKRWRGVFTVLIFALAIYSMAWFFIVGAREQMHG